MHGMDMNTYKKIKVCLSPEKSRPALGHPASDLTDTEFFTGGKAAEA